MTKSRMKCMIHKACMEETRNAYKILVKNMKGRGHLEDISIYGRILKLMLKLGMDWIQLSQDRVQ
jgi:effector-binding domain-containing protein